MNGPGRAGLFKVAKRIGNYSKKLRASKHKHHLFVSSKSKKMKTRLSDTETKLFLSAIDHASVGLALYDADGRFVYANDRYSKLLPQIASLLNPGVHRDEIVKLIESCVVSRDAALGAEQIGDAWIRRDDQVLPNGGIVSICTDITDLVRREESTEVSEQRYKDLVENQPEFVSSYTPDGVLTFVNTAYASQHGLSREEMIGRNIFDFLPASEHMAVRRYIAELSRDNPYSSIENRVVMPDGSIHWQEWTDRAFFDESGRVTELQAFGRDVTERKRIENELIESRHYIGNVMNHIADSVVTIDESGKILSFNKAAEVAFGYDADEVVGHDIEILMPEPDRSRHSGYIRAYFQSGESAILGKGPRELLSLRKDGTTFPIELAISEMQLGERRVFIGAMRDISERKRIEEDLRASEARLSESQRIAGLGNWVWNIETNELSWSDGLYRIFGRAPREHIESYPAFLSGIHPDDRAQVEEAVQRTLESGEPYGIDHRVVWPDGSVHVIYERGEVEFDEAGKPVRMSGTAQDITERKQIEEELHQSQKMEAVGQLTGGIAHDFNNLLAVMLGSLELLRDHVEADGPGGELIGRGLSAAHRGAELTDRLLTFSRKQALSPATLDLNAVVSNMIELLRLTLGNEINIVFGGSRSLWLCHADLSQLENALINLSINARDAMAGGGSLTIETANISLGSGGAAAQADVDPGDYVVLTVLDTGTGISDEALKQVFEPFFTTKDVGKGTGLGLSMVHGFAKQSGGSVTIDSELGKGTEIALYLPRSEHGQE